MADLTTISAGALSAKVDAHGAQLSSLTLDGCEYLWQADPRWWGKHAPILFPIVGSIRDDKASTAAGTCHLGRHGLARDYDHELVENTGSSVTYRLDSTDETLAKYPYPFRLEMTYALEGPATLAQTFSVTNTGTREMPFFLGGHPAFNVPAVPGERFEDYELRFTRPWTESSPVIADGGLLDYESLTPLFEDADRLALTHGLFAKDAVVLAGVPDDTLEMVGPSGHGVRVDFPAFDHVGVWSAAPAKDGAECPFVAIEPWCGTATRTDEDDVLEHKQNLLVAHPGETITRSFRVTLL